VHRTVVWVCLLLALGAAHAQLVVPTFGARGEVPPALTARFMEVFRQQLGIRTGLAVLPGTTIAQTLVGRLEPDVAAAIATLGGGRYSVAGEIIALDSGLRQRSYTVNLLVTDARTRRASDLFSQPLSPTDLTAAVAALTRAVGAFVSPASAPAQGSASLFITSNPAGAAVFLNGVEVGTTANPLLPLAPGTYEVELRKEGFVPESDTVTLEMDETQFLAFSLAEIRGGSILVSSVPSAEVFLDGRRVGRTPLTVEAQPGVRTLRLARPGFEPHTQSVTVRNFFVSRVPQVRLEPVYESLVFWTPLTGFTVSIDGVARPRNFAPNLQPGLHRVVLSRSGVDIPFSFELPRPGIFELDLQTNELTALE
jgi:hypothetical protein